MTEINTVRAVLEAQQHAAAMGLIHSEAVAARLGVTGTDLKCLMILLRGPHTPSELAAALRLTPSAVTTVIDRLHTAGLARRQPSTHDRRKTEIHPIEEAVAPAVHLYTPLHERMAELLTRYDDEQIRTLLDFAERSAAILGEETERLSQRSVAR